MVWNRPATETGFDFWQPGVYHKGHIKTPRQGSNLIGEERVANRAHSVYGYRLRSSEAQ